MPRHAILDEPFLQRAQTLRPILAIDVEIGPDDDRNAAGQLFNAQGQNEVVALRVVGSLHLLVESGLLPEIARSVGENKNEFGGLVFDLLLNLEPKVALAGMRVLEIAPDLVTKKA